MYLSIIIPCYNEEKRIGPTLDAIDAYLKTQSYESEIIVVDNGSKDNTKGVVRSKQADIKNLKLDERNSHGKGYAVRAGMLTIATGDYRLFTDADNSTDISQVAELLKYATNGYDVVISSRKAPGAVILNPQPGYRVFLGNVFQTLVKTIVNVGVYDTQNGFKLFKAKAAKDIFLHQTIFYWAFDVELLTIAKKLGYKVKEVPITWKNDDASTMSFKGMRKMLLEILVIRMHLWTDTYSK